MTIILFIVIISAPPACSSVSPPGVWTELQSLLMFNDVSLEVICNQRALLYPAGSFQLLVVRADFGFRR